MKLNRSVTVPAPAAGQDEATHVLHWLPGWLAGTGHGYWALQEAAGYEDGVPAVGCLENDAPRDADPAELALWAAAVLGYRVTLDKTWAAITSLTLRPPALHSEREPLYYVAPAAYTDPLVTSVGVAEGWADPEEDPALIGDWPGRQSRAAIWFDVAGGRPVHPYGWPSFVRRGRNGLGLWGENLAADAFVTATRAGVRHLLLVKRGDDGTWALPGGMAGPGEAAVMTALRELWEETGLDGGPARVRVLPARAVPDPRASAEAWAVTRPVLLDLGDVDELPAVEGGDDAREAAWVAARDYEGMSRALLFDHGGGDVFPAHVAMIAALLDGEDPAPPIAARGTVSE